MEDFLQDRLEVLEPFGYKLEFVERQLICSGHGGRIDLLCYDTSARNYVVIELKNVIAGQNTFGQIATYWGWVQQHYRARRAPTGLVIARGFDNRFLSAARLNKRIAYLTIEEIGLT